MITNTTITSLTGYMWDGVGAEYKIPSNAVYMVRERAGERDLHFSVKGCGRVTEAPGASQSICANEECGVVIWHLQRLRFEKDMDSCSDDFSLIVFKNGTQKLLWRDQDGAHSMWRKTDSSPDYIKPQILTGALERVKQTVKKYQDVFGKEKVRFPQPSFVPKLESWRAEQPLKRRPKESKYKFLAAVLMGLHVTPGRRLAQTLDHWKKFRVLQGAEKDDLCTILLDLLSKDWMNCQKPANLIKLADKLGCHKDTDREVLANTEMLMIAIVDRLAWSIDFKVADFALRQEIHIERKTAVQGCRHPKTTVERFLWATIPLAQWEHGRSFTVEDLQKGLDRIWKEKIVEVVCQECGQICEKTTQKSLCSYDPDFLTLRMGHEVTFKAKDVTLHFGRSSYTVWTVVHWDSNTRKAFVSCKPITSKDWYRYGVDEDQKQSKRYTEDELADSAQLAGVAVMMAVRTGSFGGSDKDEEDTAVEVEDHDFASLSSSFRKNEVSRSGVAPEEETDEANVSAGGEAVVNVPEENQTDIDVSVRGAAQEEEIDNANDSIGGKGSCQKRFSRFFR